MINFFELDKDEEKAQIEKKIEQIEKCIETASSLSLGDITYVIAQLLCDVGHRVDNEKELGSFIAHLMYELKSATGNNSEVSHDFFTSLEPFYKWLQTPGGQIVKRAVSQGENPSLIMESLINKETLEMLNTLNKV